MRVLFVHDRDSARGGTEVYLDSLRSALERRGVRVLEVGAEGPLPSGDGGRRAVEEAAASLGGVEVVHFHDLGVGARHLDWIPSLSAGARAAPRYFLTLHNLNYVCPGTELFELRRGRICERPFRPLACSFHALLDHCQSLRPWRIFENTRRCLRFSRARPLFETLFVASRFMRERLALGDHPARRVEVLPYFTEIPPPWGPPPASSRLLFVGRIERPKGLPVLLEALALLPSEVSLVVAGDGSRRSEAQALAERLGIAARVEFASWREGNSLDALYERAAVVVLPSLWPEPFGIVGIEAMARARPVVAFDVGGVRDWLEDGRTGLVARPGDARDLAEKVRFLLENPERARRMGERGREAAEEKYGVERHVRQLLAAYEGAASGAGDAAEAKPEPVFAGP